MLKTMIQRVLDQMVTNPAEGRKITLHFQRRVTMNRNMTMLLIQAVALRDDDLMQGFGHIKAAGLLATVRDGDLLEIIQQVQRLAGLLLHQFGRFLYRRQLSMPATNAPSEAIFSDSIKAFWVCFKSS